jgi:hypothetical protein
MPSEARQQIEQATRQLTFQADRPPFTRLTPEARAAHVWAWSQEKHLAANNSQFNGDEALSLRRERETVKYPLGDRPLVDITRGLPVTGPMADQLNGEHQQHQAALASLSSQGVISLQPRAAITSKSMSLTS